MEIINKYLSGAIVPSAIVFFSVFFLIVLRGRPFAIPTLMISSLLGRRSEENNSGIRAVIFALAGTLGVGNIVGVASAITLGGAGAVFWMWISAFLAMILKYSEVVLAIQHRRKRDGEYYGGAMYYMMDFFTSIKKHSLGIFFVLTFIIFCLINGFTMGGIIQANAISESLKVTFGVERKNVGIFLAFLCCVVFLFNGKHIFLLCEKLVPLVSVIYIIMSLGVILLSYKSIPSVFAEIFKGAFTFESAGGGALGFLISKSLRYGTIRGLFSNEAGCGTSPIAHATSKTDNSTAQGILGIVEVFIDTIVVCTMTALVVLINKDEFLLFTDNPIVVVFNSFAVSLGEISNVVLSICVCLFAFATIVCWGYYGKECIYYYNKSKNVEKLYYCLYILAIFYGSFIKLDLVWEFADLAVGSMTLMNLFILYKMRYEVIQETNRYYKKSPRKRALKVKR